MGILVWIRRKRKDLKKTPNQQTRGEGRRGFVCVSDPAHLQRHVHYMLMVVMFKVQFLFLFLSRKLLEDLSFFSMIIYLLPLLRAGVIFTASLHYYMLLASVQAFTLLSFGDSFAEK